MAERPKPRGQETQGQEQTNKHYLLCIVNLNLNIFPNIFM